MKKMVSGILVAAAVFGSAASVYAAELPAPQELTAEDYGFDKVPTQEVSGFYLNWDAVDGADKYYVYEKKDGEADFSRIDGAYPVTVTSYMVNQNELDLDTEYKFRVAAVDVDANEEATVGKYSDIVSAKTPAKLIAPDINAPNYKTFALPNKVQLGFSSVFRAYDFEVYVLAGEDYKQIRAVRAWNGNEPAYIVSGLTAGTDYSFKVRSVGTDNDGFVIKSELSDALELTTPATPFDGDGADNVIGIFSTENSADGKNLTAQTKFTFGGDGSGLFETWSNDNDNTKVTFSYVVTADKDNPVKVILNNGRVYYGYLSEDLSEFLYNDGTPGEATAVRINF
ncbi:hypothetical protein AGMMS49975_02900 [Clostridia bacterium]|nr:hypothetical protein AGMMS49975_02900 [Clostridia bacterium]